MGSGSSTVKAKKGKEVSSPDAEPIIVWSYRKLAKYDEQIEGYDAAAKDYGDYMKSRVPGVYCYSYHPHPGKGEGVVCDVQWFNSIEDFRGHMFMTELTGMKKMLAFTSKTDPKYNYRGYVFGAWEQTWYMGMGLPTMFGNMPPTSPAWFEFREQAAGFIKQGPASSNKPPIMIMSEWLVQDGEVESAIEMWQGTCEELKKNDQVRAHWLSRECLRFKLRDKDKQRNPNLLVAISAFEDVKTFGTALELFKDKVANFKAIMAAPLTAEIWAEDDEDDKVKTLEKGMKEFDADGKYTFFKLDGRGWSDHSGTTGKYDDEKLPEADMAAHKELCEGCFGGFPEPEKK